MAQPRQWKVELDVLTGAPLQNVLIHDDQIYYLQSPESGQKALLYEYNTRTKTTRVVASGHPVADVQATRNEVVVLLNGFVKVTPLPDQVGEIFSLQPDGSINTHRGANSLGYLKAGIGVRANQKIAVTCKWFSLDTNHNSRILVWKYDSGKGWWEVNIGYLPVNLKQDEKPSYRWTVTPSMVYVLDADQVTVLGSPIPEDFSQIMSWSVKLPPGPVPMDAIFGTDDGRLFARSQTGQLLEHVNNEWEWTLEGQSVVPNRNDFVAGGLHAVRLDNENCYLQRKDEDWEVIGEKVAAPRLKLQYDGKTVLTGIRNGRQIVSQVLD